jgi:hypothetical protein
VEWIKHKMHTLKETAKETTSKKQGMVSLIQHCTAAHAAEVAVEQGIDVKSVNVVLEDIKAENASSEAANETRSGSLREGQTVVGYIDAPNATDEEVMQYAERLTKACPAANTMKNHMEWRRAPSSSSSSSLDDIDDLRGRWEGQQQFPKDKEGSSGSNYTAPKGSGFSALGGGAFASKKQSQSYAGNSNSGSSFRNPFTDLNIPKAPPSNTGSTTTPPQTPSSPPRE